MKYFDVELRMRRLFSCCWLYCLAASDVETGGGDNVHISTKLHFNFEYRKRVKIFKIMTIEIFIATKTQSLTSLLKAIYSGHITPFLFYLSWCSQSQLIHIGNSKYRISANSFRGNYSLLNLTLCTMTFGYSTYRCRNY